jgi:hypothetical protein
MRVTKFFNKFCLAGMVLVLFGLSLPLISQAMPLGTLLYRTSRDGKMYGYSSDPLILIENGVMKNIYPGHVGIYIGREDGVDYVVEALANGVVKTPAKQFVNTADGEKFLGAKLPRQLTTLQRSKAVALAKSLAARGLDYDVDFQSQKGPASGQWTCVGLVEKIYESADISNPNNLAALEYNENYYAVDITPDGFDSQSVFNEDGDCLSRDLEFSKIFRRIETLLPLPELVGYNAGLEYQGERYIFLPYTQFLQASLTDVVPDIPVASEFSSDEERGRVKAAALILRWSLVNNPESSLNRIVAALTGIGQQAVDKGVALVRNIGELILGSKSQTKISVNNLSTSTKSVGTAKSSTKSSASSKSSTAKAGSATQQVIDNAPPVKMNINSKIAKTDSKAATKTGTNQSATGAKTGTSSKLVNTKVASPVTASSSLKTAAAKVPTPTVSSSEINNSNAANMANSGSGSGSGSSSNVRVLSPILINKIYSTGDNNWLQLYNPTASDYDLATNEYRLEKVKAAVDPSFMVRIGNTADGAYPGGTVIPAHGYYLLVSSKANSYYRTKAQAIITRDDFFWPKTGYTIYLGSGAISSYDDPDIIDAVGFGPDAAYFQGSGPASLITDNFILARNTNQHDNALDFCLIPSDDPGLAAFFAALNSGQSATTTESTTATSTNQTATSTEQIASSTEIIATSTETTATSSEPTDETDPTDNSEDDGESDNQTTEPDLALISKIYSTGENDWLELYNPTEHDLDLAVANFRLERAVTLIDPKILIRFGNLDDGTYPGGTVIPAGGRYLVVRNEATPYYLNQADAIASRTDFAWTGSGHSLYLGRGSLSSSTDSDIVDLVGIGPDATYWQGSAPAPAITDYLMLNRISATGQNNSDFELIEADDPDKPIGSATSTIPTVFTNPFFASLPDLYVPPPPLNSPGLTDSWNFDECYGAGSHTVGRWGCARQIGMGLANLQATLAQPIDLDNLSVSFYYRSVEPTPSAILRLYNSAGEYAKVGIKRGLITVEGLPTNDIYFWGSTSEIPFDENWHLATLVVNQAEDYWAVYIDGEQRAYKNFMSDLTPMTSLEVSGNQSVYQIDELAVWNRSLSLSEVVANQTANRPFFPAFSRADQLPAVLKYFWRFEEDAGVMAIDEMSSTTLSVYSNLWLGRKHNNYAMSVDYNNNLSANLATPIVAQDLSVTFWWRNAAYPSFGRANVALSNSADSVKLFSFQADNTSQPTWLNDNYSLLSAAFPNNDLWHHIGVVYDSYRYRLIFYLDGVEKLSRPWIRYPGNQTINKLVVSTNANGSAIDDLSLWEGALSAAEIDNIFANTK